MMRNQSANRSWAVLLVVGGLILTAAVLFQGIVSAAPVAEQGAARTPEDRGRGLRVSFATEGGRLGISIDDVESPERPGSPTEGAIVRSVTIGSPAADAGLEDGDIVVEFDGERVRSSRQLSRLVQETPVGREVPLFVMRDDERLRLSVTPEEVDSLTAFREWMPDLDHWEQRLRQALPQSLRRDREFLFEGQLRDRQRLGIEVTDIGPQLAEHFGVDHGVLVTSVLSESVAADAGLQAGDILTAIEGKSVSDVGALHRLVAAIAPPVTVQLAVWRDGAALTLAARFEEAPEPQRSLHRRI